MGRAPLATDQARVSASARTAFMAPSWRAFCGSPWLARQRAASRQLLAGSALGGL